MGEQPRCGADSLPQSQAREHDGESAHVTGGTARTEALGHRAERQNGESDRGGPGLERDPYRDEGGEA